MEVEWPPVREPGAQRVWRDVLQPIAAEMRRSVAELTARTVSHIQAEAPELLPDAQIVEEARNGTEESLTQLAQLIELSADPRRLEPPPSTLAFIRSAVWRQVPLADNMRFYRLAQEQVWQWFFARITETCPDPGDLATALELTTRFLFAFVDGATVRVDEAYEIERETWLRGAAAARADAIDDILADREHDGQAASKRLRYDVGRHHLGVIAWVDHVPATGDALALLNESLSRVARSFAAESSLTQPTGSLVVAAWFSSPRAFPTDEVAIVESGWESNSLPDGLSIAVGEPGHGLAGFRRTHIQAGHARRVASLVAPHGGPVTRYRDVAVAALCTADGNHAAAFVGSVLGQLAADDDVTFRLATTLATYLRENRSRTRTAALLGVHPNTVSYRVRQAEELLGRDLAGDLLDLQVALELLPALRRLE
ncbi:CdaR family transcriptional regulator [Mycobacterium sp. URHB0044]|uniref:PucR family transcriptional regulator n=1 Tax=Mycobacterium sp. URHB0044 TaxID=1380386 RepID=UPI00048F7F98|nr:helix-turn-helix domain-containing protein [Mycobacterium sp. URHB0044]